MLEALEQMNLFLIPLDDERGAGIATTTSSPTS